MRPPRRLLLILGSLLVTASCSSGDSASTTTPPPPASTTTTQAPTTTTAAPTTQAPTTTTTTTTVAPTTTTLDPNAPPPLNPIPTDENDLSEYVRIAREHMAYQNWLGMNPTVDPDVLGLVFHPDGPYYERFKAQMQSLLDDGEYREDDLELDFVAPFPESDPGRAAMKLVVDFLRERLAVMDAATGDIVVESVERQLFAGTIELRVDPSGRWLLWNQEAS